MEKMKGIYRRGDNRWEARYKKGVGENGRAIYGSVYGKTMEEAAEKRRMLVGEAAENQGIARELNLLILGAGTHGRDVKAIAESLRVFRKISFLDDFAEGEQIIGKCRDALRFKSEYPCAFVAIGDNERRKRFAKFLKERNFLIPSLIAPTAILSPNASIGEGVAILPQSTVNEAAIGDFTILASNSLVNSDSEVGAFSHIDCGAIVLKGKKVPEGTWVKSGKVY